MPKGLPASYIRKARKELGKGASFSRIFKRAWELYKGSKVYKALKGNPGNPRKKSKSRKGGRKMAKKRRRRRTSMTIPLAPIAGFIAAPATRRIIDDITKGAWDDIPNALGNYVGYAPSAKKWTWQLLMENLGPIITGLLVHKFVGGPPLNLNRVLARHKIPLIRI